MTKRILVIFLMAYGFNSYSQKAELIKAETDSSETSIERYKGSEMWGIWTMPIGKPFSTSELIPQGQIDYAVNNLNDYDLNTAWIEGKDDFGIGERFGFIFNFPVNTIYGGAYQFYGVLNIFNGYCKSLDSWKNNSRVKKLKVYYNDNYVCELELLDTWHQQFADIGKFFKNRNDNKYLDAPYEIIENDTLSFEIIEIYKGDKFTDVAISEFMCEGAGN